MKFGLKCATAIVAIGCTALPVQASVTASLIGNNAYFEAFNASGPLTSSTIDFAIGTTIYTGVHLNADAQLSSTDISFKNGAVTSGQYSRAFVTTGVAITFTNDEAFAVTPVLNSTLLAAGIGTYLTESLNLGSCSSAALQFCGQTDGTNLFAPYDVASTFGPTSMGFAFDVSVNGSSIYNLAGEMGIAGGNFYTNFNGADSVLNGFAQDTISGDPRALGYSWNDTSVAIVLPDLLAAGDSVTAIYTVTSWIDSYNSGCVQQGTFVGTRTVCLIGYSSFGDPVGARGIITNTSINATASFLLPTASVDPTTQTMTVRLPGVTLPPATGSVPEPASWAMLIGGFAMVGGALRRRRAAFA